MPTRLTTASRAQASGTVMAVTARSALDARGQDGAGIDPGFADALPEFASVDLASANREGLPCAADAQGAHALAGRRSRSRARAPAMGIPGGVDEGDRNRLAPLHHGAHR